MDNSGKQALTGVIIISVVFFSVIVLACVAAVLVFSGVLMLSFL